MDNSGLVKPWFDACSAEEAVKNLRSHEFEATIVQDRSAACNEIMKRIPSSKTVGIGGSITIREIGLMSKLEKQGNVLFDHWKPELTQDELLKIRKAQRSCDVFITSSNAITLNGEIVNTDGFGNRIASMVFGPKEVIIVVGRNKIVKDVQEAINRIRRVAAPMSAKRFGANPPCVELVRCIDCDSPDRICRATLILERKPFSTDIFVILVQEDLGY